MKRARPVRLVLEQMEDRVAPATLEWLGLSSEWNDGQNWRSRETLEVGATPTSVDDVIIDDSCPPGALEIIANGYRSVGSLTLGLGFTLNMNSGFTARDVYLEGGTLNAQGPSSVSNFAFNGGSFGGTTDLYISTSLNWQSGAMAGSGTTSLLDGASAAFGAATLADTRTFVNATTLPWTNAFNVGPSARLVNDGTFTFTDVTMTYDAAIPIINQGTLLFQNCTITFSGPLNIGGTTRIPGGWNSRLTIIGNVSLHNLYILGDITGPGNLTITNRFEWQHGIMSGEGTTYVAPTGTFGYSPHPYRIIEGRPFLVQGQRELAGAYMDAAAWLAPQFLSRTFVPGEDPDPLLDLAYDGDFTNYGSRGSAAPVGPVPFNANTAAGEIYRAMKNDVTLGTNEDKIYAELEKMVTSDPAVSAQNKDALVASYQQLYPGRILYAALLAELIESPDEWKRAQALWNLDWNRYVAVTLHEGLFAWTDQVDQMCRVLMDARTTLNQVSEKYSSEYQIANSNGTYTNANLQNDVSAKLYPAPAARVLALLNGNLAMAEAAAIYGLVRSLNGPEFRTAEAMFSLLRNHSTEQMNQIRTQYNILAGANVFDADVASYFTSSPNIFGSAQNQIDYAMALISGDKIMIAVRQLRLAMGGNWDGTDEDVIWTTLNGLYADERAMVGQTYHKRYGKSLLGDLRNEFSNNVFDGPELDKTLKLYRHGGLTLAERVYYAVSGVGTDEAALRAALAEIRNLTPAQINELFEQYAALSGGESLRNAILGLK